MKKISIKEIAEAVSGRLLYGDPDLEVSSITTDSREVPEEALFIPIKGENANVHRFLEGAVKNGKHIPFFTAPSLFSLML